jgi:hypothetical protein
MTYSEFLIRCTYSDLDYVTVKRSACLDLSYGNLEDAFSPITHPSYEFPDAITGMLPLAPNSQPAPFGKLSLLSHHAIRHTSSHSPLVLS